MEHKLVDPQLVHNTLCANLRCLRKRMGLSQEDLARRVGLNRGNIASYEKGTAEPKLSNLLKISYVFGVSVNDLTRRDLECEHTYKRAYNKYLRLNSEEENLLADYKKQATEFEDVMNGIQKYYDFATKTNGCCDPMMDAQYSQLAHLSRELLQAHRGLLEFVQCRLAE